MLHLSSRNTSARQANCVMQMNLGPIVHPDGEQRFIRNMSAWAAQDCLLLLAGWGASALFTAQWSSLELQTNTHTWSAHTHTHRLQDNAYFCCPIWSFSFLIVTVLWLLWEGGGTYSRFCFAPFMVLFFKLWCNCWKAFQKKTAPCISEMALIRQHCRQRLCVCVCVVQKRSTRLNLLPSAVSARRQHMQRGVLWGLKPLLFSPN